MPHFVVIGQTGQLARALAARAGELELTFFSRQDCDLASDNVSLETFASDWPQCDAVILAAAYTAVDQAETDQDTANQVNGVAPGIFAKECEKRGVPLVHLSTDYVFDGTASSPMKPKDGVDPLNHYGASKLAGEKAILRTGCAAAILRTSWVFDGTGKNFMTTMLRLAQERDTLNVVNDQIGRPTYAGHLADACLAAAQGLILDPDRTGVYHVSNTGRPISWADFADAIFTAAASDIPNSMTVNRIGSEAFPTPAKRPDYSVMDTQKFEATFNHPLPDWNTGLSEAINEWKTQKQEA